MNEADGEIWNSTTPNKLCDLEENEILHLFFSVCPLHRCSGVIFPNSKLDQTGRQLI